MDTPLDYTNLPFAIRWVGKSNADGKIKLSFQFLVPKGVLQIGNVNSNDLDLSLAAAALRRTVNPLVTSLRISPGYCRRKRSLNWPRKVSSGMARCRSMLQQPWFGS